MIHSGAMATTDRERRWHVVLDRLRRGPAPRGATFDLCRRLLDAAPPGPESVQAVRMLLEGAMADAATDSGDAQEVMAILKAADGGLLDLEALLDHP